MATVVRSIDLVGKKEAVDDIISNLSPTKTPFLTSICKETITNTDFTWLEDNLRAGGANAAVEGAEYVDSDRNQPSTRGNHAQILTETFKVNGTSDVVKTYGRAKASAYEAVKTGAVLKLDLEYALVGSAQTKVQRTASVAGKMAGVQAMIDASTTVAAPDGDTGTGGTQASPLTEEVLLEVIRKLHNEGAEAGILMIKPDDALKVANFAYRKAAGGTVERTRELGAEARKIVNVIDFYVSPLGEVKVVTNRNIKADNSIVYDADMWKLQVLRPWFKETLAKTGDAERYAMTGEFSLKHRNFKASGLITNLS